jgi:hypothetical protein
MQFVGGDGAHAVVNLDSDPGDRHSETINILRSKVKDRTAKNGVMLFPVIAERRSKMRALMINTAALFQPRGTSIVAVARRLTRSCQRSTAVATESNNPKGGAPKLRPDITSRFQVSGKSADSDRHQHRDVPNFTVARNDLPEPRGRLRRLPRP